MIAAATDESIYLAAKLLAEGHLVGMPTETVYGLAANAWNPAAVARIYVAKSRPSSNPLIVHVASVDRLKDAIHWPPEPLIQRQLDAVIDLWPGPLTVVCNKSDQVPMEVTAGKQTVAVRIPAHPVALKLLSVCDFPIAAPSANRSKYISPTCPEHLLGPSGIAEHLSLVLDGGACCWGLESTIVMLGQQPQLLRPGAISVDELAKRFGVSTESMLGARVISPSDDSLGDELLAPGMMREHYCPSTRLRLISNADTLAELSNTSRIGRIAFQPLPPSEAQRYETVITLSDAGDLAEIARGLFAALRTLDAQGLDLICCDTCEPTGLGHAIMDRLHRAAARYEWDE